MEKEYIESLNEKQLKALAIVKDHLKSSFDIKKSIGYKKFIEKTKK